MRERVIGRLHRERPGRHLYHSGPPRRRRTLPSRDTRRPARSAEHDRRYGPHGVSILSLPNLSEARARRRLPSHLRTATPRSRLVRERGDRRETFPGGAHPVDQATVGAPSGHTLSHGGDAPPCCRNIRSDTCPVHGRGRQLPSRRFSAHGPVPRIFREYPPSADPR